MLVVEQQLHGYRQGHQLLSSTIKLAKPDQEVVDRLSDVAGPLRPGDRFDSYLTCYPLPSGTHYVLARTWQDFDAPRAGCVRTRSLIVPMADWMGEISIAGLVKTLALDGGSAPAKRVHVSPAPSLLPQVEITQVIELIEALFLEDRKPIVVFDSSDPEGITLRLLSAAWSSFRRTFSASTFALSPRSLGARSFDLVFAPKDARSRFSDWAGRRIDARKPTGARHKWSNELVARVFSGINPSLFPDDSLGDLSSGNDVNEAELRISLLWNELREKLATSPNAALGLLDIANSRTPRNIRAIARLEPELGHAAQRAASTLSPSEAWRFLLALTDKLIDIQLRPSVTNTIRNAAVHLSTKFPAEAIANVEMLATALDHELLLGAVGDGLAQTVAPESQIANVELAPSCLLKLLLFSPALAERILSHDQGSAECLTTALAEASVDVRVRAKPLLRFLVNDWQAEAASILIENLSLGDLLDEVSLLSNTNGLLAENLHGPLVNRAKALDAVEKMRERVCSLPESPTANALLLRLVEPDSDDLHWLLEHPRFTDGRRFHLVQSIVRSANSVQFNSMIRGNAPELLVQYLMRDPAGSFDIIDNILETGLVEAAFAVDISIRMLRHAQKDQMHRLAWRALKLALTHDTGSNHSAKLDQLLETMGSGVNGTHLIRTALQGEVPGAMVAADLAAFNRSQPNVRDRILLAIEDLASMIVARGRIDYSEVAVVDAATLLWDSSTVDQRAFVRSATTLLPFLLRSPHEPVSSLIAAAFPAVYQELKKADDEPNFFTLLLFTEVGRSRNARHALVEALMHSTWKPADIALAAARAGDIDRVLRLIGKHEDGARVIVEIESHLSTIPTPWREQVERALIALHERHFRNNDES